MSVLGHQKIILTVYNIICNDSSSNHPSGEMYYRITYNGYFVG